MLKSIFHMPKTLQRSFVNVKRFKNSKLAILIHLSKGAFYHQTTEKQKSQRNRRLGYPLIINQNKLIIIRYKNIVKVNIDIRNSK